MYLCLYFEIKEKRTVVEDIPTDKKGVRNAATPQINCVIPYIVSSSLKMNNVLKTAAMRSPAK